MVVEQGAAGMVVVVAVAVAVVALLAEAATVGVTVLTVPPRLAWPRLAGGGAWCSLRG